MACEGATHMRAHTQPRAHLYEVHTNAQRAAAAAPPQGSDAAWKNETLFERFGINYAHLPAMFRKGSVVLRRTEEVVVKVDATTGKEVRRKRATAVVCHEDIIGDKFYRANPELGIEADGKRRR